MNTRIWQSVLSITRQLRRIGTNPCGWLSDSGKGIKEYTGYYRGISRTARGLTILLNTGRRVCWRVSQTIADRVLGYWDKSVRTMEATDLAIGLAMMNRSDVFSLEEQVNAVCDVYPNADRRMVLDVLASWL